MISDVTGVLLAGGKSRRMGEDKRFILVGQRTLFERSCAVLCELFEQVCVVIAQDSPSLQANVPVIRRSSSGLRKSWWIVHGSSTG